MLINALCDYYDVLSKEQKVLPEGYSKTGVKYLVSLTEEGEVDDVIDWQVTETLTDKKGKVKEKLIPRTIRLPKRTEKPGIESNIIEHRPTYIFGLLYEKDVLTANDKTEKAKKSHDAFVKANLDFIDGIDSPIVNAYRLFIQSWVPEEETENPLLISLGKNYSTSSYAFCLSGHPEILLHEDEKIISVWNNNKSENVPKDDEVMAQCGISGEYSKMVRIHDKIRGFNAMGSVLVNFNNPAENSYGKSQSYNGNVSENVMRKYTEALNYLLSSNLHRSMLGDVTVVHWAALDDDRCDNFISSSMFSFSDKMSIEETDDSLKEIQKKLKRGKVTSDTAKEFEEYIDPDMDYYMVGFKPNSSRIAVKFIYRKKFGEIVNNVIQHNEDMKIGDRGKTASISRILKELASPYEKAPAYDPAGMEKLMYAVIHGTPYPYFLLSNVINRIKNDSDTDKNSYIKMNDVRIGILKAYINRKNRFEGKEEEIKLALDKENRDQAYLCGRLFAVYEAIQQKASNYSLNRTIRDSYFSSAAARPAVTFPKVIALAQHHLSKIGDPKYFSEEICEIMDKLEQQFPLTLDLTEQGKFFIGYYQQKSYSEIIRKNKKIESEEN